MKIIYKYRLNYDESVELLLPPGYKVLHVGTDRTDHPCIWIEVTDDRACVQQLRLMLVATGEFHNLDNYFGTVKNRNGYIWHVYEAGGNKT